MKKMKGIHHISAFTKSADENYHFYAELLGLRLVQNTVNQENTSIRHLFYGDYIGTPGTLLTFFEFPRVGSAYPENNYFSTVTLKVPSTALSYWKERLETESVEALHFDKEKNSLSFNDPDGLPLRFVETEDVLPADRATKHSDVPASKQITGIYSVEIAVEDTEKEAQFLQDWLDFQPTESASQLIDTSESVLVDIVETTSDKRTRFGRGSIDHLAFSYEDEEALEERKAKAEELGLKVEKLVNRGFFSSLYVKDPFGQRFELATLGPGFAENKPVENLGKELELPEFLEPERDTIERKLEAKE